MVTKVRDIFQRLEKKITKFIEGALARPLQVSTAYEKMKIEIALLV